MAVGRLRTLPANGQRRTANGDRHGVALAIGGWPFADHPRSTVNGEQPTVIGTE